MSGSGNAADTTDAELDRLAEEALRAEATEDAELDNLAAELLSEGTTSGAGAGGAPNGSSTTTASVKPTPSSAAPTPVHAPGTAGAAAASGMAALNSLMSRARGMRFATGSVTGSAQVPDPYAVLGVRDAAIWRQVLANDAARPPAGPRATSRSYRCDNSRVNPLDDKAAEALARDAAESAAVAIKANQIEKDRLRELATNMAPAFRAEIERALAARIATDPDFDSKRFPVAAARFAL